MTGFLGRLKCLLKVQGKERPGNERGGRSKAGLERMMTVGETGKSSCKSNSEEF
jgi:hypothetical protein